MSANRSAARPVSRLPACAALATIVLWLGALAGCRSATPGAALNPLDPSMALPAAKTLEYPGPPRFWNTAGLVISPARIVALVGTEVPMFAGVCDGQGQLQPYEKIEWMLDNGGVGSFVSVSESIRPFCLELISTKSRKIDNSYAETETLPANVILTRGTTDINDDMVMPRGYTWVTVTSPAEGTSYVTAYAPDVYSWDVRQKSATIHWIDAEWRFPDAVSVPAGTSTTLATCVYRKTTKAPVADWIVKYTITGGAAAGLGPENAQSVEVATREDGRAAVEVIPAANDAETTCITVELIRSECATPGSPERLSVATAATQVTWTAPQPPPSIPVTPTVPVTPPPPISPAEPAPPATTPPAAPPPTAPPEEPPPPPVAPQIELDVTGPQTAEMGEDIRFTLQVTNRGDTPATDLIVIDRFDEGLQHPQLRSPIERDFGTLEPGETRSVEIKFRIHRAGKLCHTVEITDARVLGQGTRYATKEACVTVAEPPPKPEQPAMTVNVTGPQAAVVGGVAEFTIVVENTGDVPAEQVRIVAEFEQEFVPARASEGAFRPHAQTVGWQIESLQPQQREERKIQCKCVAASPRACCQAKVSDASGQILADDVCLPVQQAAAPAQGPLRLEVIGRDNPVRVGNQARYRITVRNAGQNSERQVQLTIVLPEQMTLVGVPQSGVKPSIAGREIRFDPILELRPGETFPPIELVLKADRPGEATLSVQATSSNVPQPLTATERTTIVAQ